MIARGSLHLTANSPTAVVGELLQAVLTALHSPNGRASLTLLAVMLTPALLKLY